ncbi:Histone-lysine N-methyltransferase SETD2 [Aphelenchoides besseyi]|nr:Histone-lysine N-methyltransferase SETD2 [Aphelenchoides besseyi]KAI6202213.1 Histone-lysine N-methyltransferase SETD2 [Aphelenchoides besseyi]
MGVEINQMLNDCTVEQVNFKIIESCIARCDESLLRLEYLKPRCDCFVNEEKKPCSEESNCANRAMNLECYNCKSGDKCENRRFQKRQYAKVEVRPSGLKGLGLFACEDIKRGKLIIEYVGEIIDRDHCDRRSRRYARNPKHKHHYLMNLTARTFIDSTKMGNIARYINHSCEPNAVTEKWTINKRTLRIRNPDFKGEKRITSTCVGFFAIKDIKVGEEIVFDYQFERFGKRAQKCYCGAATCRGYISSSNNDDEIVEDDGNRDDIATDTSDEDNTTDESEEDEEDENVKNEVSSLIISNANSTIKTEVVTRSPCVNLKSCQKDKKKVVRRVEKPKPKKRQDANKLQKRRNSSKIIRSSQPSTPTSFIDDPKKSWFSAFKIPRRKSQSELPSPGLIKPQTPDQGTETDNNVTTIKTNGSQSPSQPTPPISTPTIRETAKEIRPPKRSRFEPADATPTNPLQPIKLPDFVMKLLPTVDLNLNNITPSTSANSTATIPTDKPVDQTSKSSPNDLNNTQSNQLHQPSFPVPTYHAYAGTGMFNPAFLVPPPPQNFVPFSGVQTTPITQPSGLTGLQYWNSTLPLDPPIPSGSNSFNDLQSFLNPPPPPPPQTDQPKV